MDPESGRHLSPVSESVNNLSENMRAMTRSNYPVSESMQPMLVNMYGINLSAESINRKMHAISRSMDAVSDDMGGVSDSIRPVGRINRFMPYNSQCHVLLAFADVVVAVARQGSCYSFSNTAVLPAVHAGSETAVGKRAGVVLCPVHCGPV